MAAQRWMFTTEQLMNTPSRKCGIDADKELSYRQQAANLIQDMGQRLQVEQLCINTAIVYMHRFYMFRSFTRFPRNEMAPACLFLAAKVEEQPRKLEHVIKVAHACLNRDHNTPTPDPKTEAYLEQAQQLVINENILLQTLGFEVTVDHPHTHVVKASTVILAKASKDLSKTSYYLATNSLHMTTMCLQHRPTVVACVCIYMACRWANYKIPRSNEGREWFQYIDQKVTLPLIEELYNEFLNILNKSPMKLKRKIMGWKGNEGQAREEERPGQSSSQELNRPSTSTHNKHSSHDQRDGPESNKHNHPDQKQCHEHKESRAEHKKEHYPEKRPSEHKPMSSSHNPDRKPQTSHPPDPSKHVKREDRHDGHSHSQPHRKEVQHHMHAEYRDKNVTHERHKDLVQVKKEANVNGQNHSSNSSIPSVKPHNEVIKTEHKDNPVVKEEPPSQLVSTSTNLPHSQTASGMPSKSKTAIDFNEYVKRREQEKIEREKQMEREKLEKAEREKRHEKERIERDKLLKHRGSDTDLLNKTFSEGSGREQTKHRPPKLDISLPLIENHVDQKPSVSSRDRTERPYHVNIKSPIKPHYNITVKSPIKSSDLKQPKVELSKVQITPEKDGADPFSVNINTDPAIRKLIESDKQECGNSIKPSTNAPGESFISDSDIKKEEPELEPGEIIEPEITLNPEHSSAPDFKIKELNYDPEDGLDSAAALRLKQESDASNTPALSRVKTEPSSGSNTPVRLKLPTQGTSSGNSPLKIKISTKGLSSDSNHSSSKHSSPHRHKHKHKDKHKSHKHSRDKERHREKHREKEATSTETNGQPSSLKLSLKLSDIPGGASSERWSVKNKHERHKNRASISDPSLNKSSNSLEPERSQPWSMTDLIPKSGSSVAQSPSRKRRRMPTVDQNTEHPSQTKAAKMGSNRIRRSSSNHSVVSMELSDGEDGQATNGPQEQNTLSLLNLNLMQAIAQTKQKVESLRSQSTRNSPRDPKPQVNRQQSGFDLEGMMWAGSGSSEAPPLPPSHPAPPPPPPDQVKPPPPLS